MNLVAIFATAAVACIVSCGSTAATTPAQQHQSLRVVERELLTPTRPPPFCVREEATDFVDNDLSNKPGQVGDCCGYCDASNECAAWSWSNYNGGTCWLKRGRGTVVANANVISGVKMGYQELYPCADLEYGVDFVGYDIGSVRMLKPADCCLECSRFPGCKAFTHTKYNDGTCWLKSQKGRMIYNRDATSSVAYGTSASVPNCGLEVNVDYVGNDIGSAPATQPGECCAKCQAFAGCRAFSWSASTNTCYFKNRKDATIAKSGVTSAAVFANPRAPSCAMELGTDYVGNDIGSAPSADPYGCCSICMKAGGCGAFSWTNQNGGTCWLKSTKGTTVANANVQSAVV